MFATHTHEFINTLVPGLKRVSGDNKDHVYMYKVVHSVNLEAYALTVQFQEGAMGYIPGGVLIMTKWKT